MPEIELSTARNGERADKPEAEFCRNGNHNRDYRKQNERKPRIYETYHNERADNRQNGQKHVLRPVMRKLGNLEQIVS